MARIVSASSSAIDSGQTCALHQAAQTFENSLHSEFFDVGQAQAYPCQASLVCRVGPGLLRLQKSRKRNLGPARRARAFKWRTLGIIRVSCAVLPKTVLPLHALAFTSHNLFRTIEVGALNKSQVHIRPRGWVDGYAAKGTITVTIVSSKMDYNASGFRI